MLAKITTKNQITLPKAIINLFPNIDYFDVHEENGQIILIPLKPNRAYEVREKLEEMGINESDVNDAIDLARQK